MKQVLFCQIGISSGICAYERARTVSSADCRLLSCLTDVGVQIFQNIAIPQIMLCCQGQPVCVCVCNLCLHGKWKLFETDISCFFGLHCMLTSSLAPSDRAGRCNKLLSLTNVMVFYTKEFLQHVYLCLRC